MDQSAQLQSFGRADDLPAAAHTRLAPLHRYWRTLAAKGYLPKRDDLDPARFRRQLDSVFLLDVIEQGDGIDFRFRLVGETINQFYRWKLKGRCFSELLQGQALRDTLDEHRLCVTAACPVFRVNDEYDRHSGDRWTYHRLLLPLAEDGRRVDRLIGMMVFLPLAPTTTRQRETL